MQQKSDQRLILSLQKRQFDRPTLVAYTVKKADIDGVLAFTENLSTNLFDKQLYDDNELAIIKITQEISEKSLLKFFAKSYKSADDFYAKLSLDSSLSEYVNSYIDRRIAKCIALAAEANIPLYQREKNSPTLYPKNRLNIAQETAQPHFNFNLSSNELRYSISIEHNGNTVKMDIDNSEVLTYQPCVIRNGQDVYRIDSIDGKKMGPFTKKKYVSVPESAIRRYMESFVLNTIKAHDVEASGFDIINHIKRGSLTLLFEDRLLGGKCLIPNFIYSNRLYACNVPNKPEVTMREDNGQYSFLKSVRDTNWEQQQMDMLTEQLGLSKTSEAEFLPSSIDPNVIDNEHDVVEWINRNSSILKSNGLNIVQNNKKRTYYISNVEIDISAKAEDDWFDLYGKVTLGEFQIPFIYLKRNILHDIREYTLPNGQIFILPQVWFNKYKTIFQLSRGENEEHFKIPKSLINLIIDSHIDSPAASKIEDDIRNIANQKVEIPSKLNATLRGYQKIGFAWLWLINQNGINGCLADDMGLGKTLQTITLLQKAKEQDELRTSIIVVPTSLISNWENEIGRFAPSLKTITYAGPHRETIIDKIFDHDIVITSYGILRNDIETLRNLQFYYLILDESQNIKNPASKVYRASILMNAKHFIGLSGTPIENSLIDLWAQMNFLNRGMLGSLRNFRNEFQIPIEKYNDPNKKQQLKRLIEPLIMRRSKEIVAADLPPITEQVIQCAMTEAQAEVYEKEKSAIRNNILSNIENEGIEKSAIHILSGLTRLRQIANHPALLPEYAKLDSGKFDEITRSLTNIIAEGHKILVFSSFVKHLEQVRTYIEEQNIEYEMLTGSTQNRAQIVENFQLNTNKKVFLISLKAGGVGLNLTAADYVFVLDPWWNPAAEMQATARAHRIGQDKNVFVYRFISHNTVEEKILNLQGRKEKLAQLFVEGSNPMKYMDKELVMELLE